MFSAPNPESFRGSVSGRALRVLSPATFHLSPSPTPVHFAPMDSYQKLVERFKEAQLLRSTSATLEWDEQTYLPKKAVHYRADQLSYLASKAHLLGTAP